MRQAIVGMCVGFAVLSLVCLAGFGLAYLGMPKVSYQMLQAEQVFVAPNGTGGLVLLLDGGNYELQGDLRDGCWELTSPPAPPLNPQRTRAGGEGRKTARWVGLTCPDRGE